MSRFYCGDEDIKSGEIFITGKEAHHIYNVMRLRAKERITCFDGKGKVYAGLIVRASSTEVVVRIERMEIKRASKPKITLAQAIPKAEGMDYIVQKATELGVDKIVPLKTQHTLLKLKPNKEHSRLERWRRIAIEASKQSGRSFLPEIEKVKTFHDVLLESKSYNLSILFSPIGQRNELKRILDKFNGEHLLILVGPEGDFSSEEILLAKKWGARPISLGPRILRVETASVAILSIISYALERL